jgi:uncharacterized protein YkwD
MHAFSLRPLLFPLIACWLAAGCGTAADQLPDPDPEPGPPYVAPDSLNTFFELINDVRSKGCYCDTLWKPAANALAQSPALLQIALSHSADMDQNGYFGHEDSLGHDGADRLLAANYQWMAWGENLAWGQTAERQVFLDWLNSPSHCANLMSPYFVEYGLGRSGLYWTLMLGKPF